LQDLFQLLRKYGRFATKKLKILKMFLRKNTEMEIPPEKFKIKISTINQKPHKSFIISNSVNCSLNVY
jgi:hypothetical protein